MSGLGGEVAVWPGGEGIADIEGVGLDCIDRQLAMSGSHIGDNASPITEKHRSISLGGFGRASAN